MPTFQYRAMQANGTVTEGQLEAGGRAEAFREMEGRGLRPISLSESERANGKAQPPKHAPSGNGNSAPAPGFKLSLGGGAKKVSARALENFTRLLSSLLAAGVPLSRAMVILQKEASSPAAQAK